jgi:hypothetical protein
MYILLRVIHSTHLCTPSCPIPLPCLALPPFVRWTGRAPRKGTKGGKSWGFSCFPTDPPNTLIHRSHAARFTLPSLLCGPALRTSLPPSIHTSLSLSLAQSGAETEGKDAVPQTAPKLPQIISGIPYLVGRHFGAETYICWSQSVCGCRKVCLIASRPMGGRPCPLKSDDHRPATTRLRPYHDDDSCENLAHQDDDAYLTQSIPSGSPRSRWVGPSQTSTVSPSLVTMDAC